MGGVFEYFAYFYYKNSKENLDGFNHFYCFDKNILKSKTIAFNHLHFPLKNVTHGLTSSAVSKKQKKTKGDFLFTKIKITELS